LNAQLILSFCHRHTITTTILTMIALNEPQKQAINHFVRLAAAAGSHVNDFVVGRSGRTKPLSPRDNATANFGCGNSFRGAFRHMQSMSCRPEMFYVNCVVSLFCPIYLFFLSGCILLLA
jgi:hypothetical protein